jgi:hypothetical protein
MGRAKTHGVAEEGKDETGTLSAEPWSRLPHPLLFVKWEIKNCGLNGLRCITRAHAHPSVATRLSEEGPVREGPQAG